MTDLQPSTTAVGGSGGDERPMPVIDPKNAEFVLIHATGETTLASLNPFMVKKVIDGQAGAVESVRKLASGDLLVKVRTVNQVRDLLKLRKFHCYDVVVSIPVNMNSCRGVIYCPDIMCMSESDIVQELSGDDVVAARFITKFVNGERRKTPLINLTFGKSKLPEKIAVGYTLCPVRPYVPNPLRCFKCQKYGHSIKSCALSSRCGKCASEDHVADNCTASVHVCVSCGGSHSSSSRDCPRYKFEKEVCATKTKYNISYGEARKRVSESQETPKPNESFASAVKSKPVMCTIATQTPTFTEPRPSTTPKNTDSDTDTTNKKTYSKATSSVRPKEVKEDKTKYTKLSKDSKSHVVVPVAPSRRSSMTKSSSVESLESMDASSSTTSRGRSHSPGYSPKAKKKAQKDGRLNNS